jgi:hypothetical protein
LNSLHQGSVFGHDFNTRRSSGNTSRARSDQIGGDVDIFHGHAGENRNTLAGEICQRNLQLVQDVGVQIVRGSDRPSIQNGDNDLNFAHIDAWRDLLATTAAAALRVAVRNK